MTLINNNNHRWILLLSLLLMCATLSGCGAIGAVYQIFIDPLVPAPTIKAEHSLADKRVLIWIEPQPTITVHPRVRRSFSEMLDAVLTVEAQAKVFPYQQILDYQLKNPDYARYDLHEIGREFGADEVVSVIIESLNLHHEAGQGYYKAQLLGSAEVIDCNTGKRVWPTDQTQRRFALEDKMQEGEGNHFEGKLLDSISEKAAMTIGLWFFDHKGKK